MASILKSPHQARILLHDTMLEVQGECPGIREKLRFWRREIGFSPETHRKAVSGHYEELWTVQEKKPGQWSLFIHIPSPGFFHCKKFAVNTTWVRTVDQIAVV